MFKTRKKIYLTLFTILSLISAILADDISPARPELVESSSYIIVFKPNTNAAKISNQIQLMKSHLVNNATSTNSTTTTSTITASATTTTKAKEYNSIGDFKWFSGTFHASSLENLLSVPNRTKTDGNTTYNTDEDNAVHYYVKDTAFALQEFIQTNPPSWGLDRIDQRTGTNGQYKFANDQGRGVTVYLLDSGIREDHEDIAGRVTIGKTVVGDPDDPSDYNGHGTFVAGVCCGTKYGVAKSAEIVSVKTLDDEGNGHLSDLLSGLQWVVEQHTSKPNAKSIVNLSLGSYYSQATNDAIQEAISLGIHFVIAAGNYGEDACRYSPGSTPGAVTVGAIDEDDSVSYYSNFGKCVDIFAPGTNINSIWPTSTKATRTLTGTSMAAPHVAGSMAVFLSQKNYTPPQLVSYLKRVSSLITEDFTINNTGTYYNENKTVVDNAINTGYKVRGRQDEKTAVNILFSHPNDSTQFWIYGESLSEAGSLYSSHSLSTTLLASLFFIVTILVL